MNKNKQNAEKKNKWTNNCIVLTAATFIQSLQNFLSTELSTKLGYARRRNRSTISSLTNLTNLKLISCYML